jgi:hypothetical protein
MHINHTTEQRLRCTLYYCSLLKLKIASKLEIGIAFVDSFDLPSPLNSAAPQQGASFGKQPKPSNGDNANSEAYEYCFNVCLKTLVCTWIHKTLNLPTGIDHRFSTLPFWSQPENGHSYHCNLDQHPTNMSTKLGLVKVSVFMMRKENISEAEFHRYWTERHSKVASPWLVRHGVVKYTQVSDIVGSFSLSAKTDKHSSIHLHGRSRKPKSPSAFFLIQATSVGMALWSCWWRMRNVSRRR